MDAPAYDQAQGYDPTDVEPTNEDISVPVRPSASAIGDLAARWVGLAKARCMRRSYDLHLVGRSLSRRIHRAAPEVADVLRLAIQREAQLQGLQLLMPMRRQADEFHVGARVELVDTIGEIRAGDQGTIIALQGNMMQVDFDDYPEPLWFDEQLLGSIDYLENMQPGESELEQMQQLVDEALVPEEEEGGEPGEPGEPAESTNKKGSADRDALVYPGLHSRSTASVAQSGEESTDRDALVYPGNLGFQEMMFFYQKATEEQQRTMDQLLEEGRNDEALQLLEEVTGAALDFAARRSLSLQRHPRAPPLTIRNR